MTLYYYEYLSLGRWSPATVPDAPDVVTVAGRLRLKVASGVGREVRAVRRVSDDLVHLTLGQLAEYLGPDGRFQACIGSVPA